MEWRAHEMGGSPYRYSSVFHRGLSVARIRGLENFCAGNLGAYAPGFMLAPASQVTGWVS